MDAKEKVLATMKYETQLFGGQTNLHCMKQILHNAKSNSHGCIRLAICIATAFAAVSYTHLDVYKRQQ